MRKPPKVTPLALTRASKAFDHPDWIFELKHDGFRGVAYVERSEAKLVSRHSNVFKSFKPLCHAIGKLAVKNAVLDGEIICVDGEGVSIFNQLMFRRGQPYFYAFDLPWLNGRDLRNLPLLRRKELLKDLILAAQNPALLYADHVEQFGWDFFRIICERNCEGIVCKHKESPYDKTARWIKVKNPDYSQSVGRHALFDVFR